MARVYSLYPELLNLNGDQANALVLTKRALWAGLEVENLGVNSVVDMQSALEFVKTGGLAFLLIGHGSLAAMKSFQHEATMIREWVGSMLEMGSFGVAVGSGYELLRPEFNRGVRISDYADVELQGFKNLQGYVNTDTNLPLAQFLSERFLATMVHGPVLARNPELADFFVAGLGGKNLANQRASEVDELVKAINAR